MILFCSIDFNGFCLTKQVVTKCNWILTKPAVFSDNVSLSSQVAKTLKTVSNFQPSFSLVYLKSFNSVISTTMSIFQWHFNHIECCFFNLISFNTFDKINLKVVFPFQINSHLKVERFLFMYSFCEYSLTFANLTIGIKWALLQM